jgi:hypothetical protein
MVTVSEIDKHRANTRKSANGRTSERKAAERHGGVANTNSGCYSPSGGGSSHRNDFRTDDTSMEWKYTTAASYSLKDRELREAWIQAVAEGRTGMFGIEFSSRNRWVVMNEEDYLEQREELEQLRETYDQWSEDVPR